MQAALLRAPIVATRVRTIRIGSSSVEIMTIYRPEIDGLRAVAVFLVLGFHAFPEVVPAGFVGVDVFFVISGFLITGVILANDFSFAGFYARRARRLFPALLLVTTTALSFGWVFLTPSLFEALGKQVAAAALFLPNLLFWSEAGYFDLAASTKPLLHLWSLGVEEQFYLVWPVLMLVGVRFRLRMEWMLLTISLLSLLHCWGLSHFSHTSAAFYSPLARAWELSAGGFLAVMKTGSPKSANSTIGVIVGVSMIALIAFFGGGQAAWPNRFALVIVVGSMLAIRYAATSRLAMRTLGSGLMVFLGRISYPLYLWHWPILVFAYIKNGTTLAPWQASACLVASICLAILTYLAVEVPLKKHLRLSPLVRGAVASLAVVGLAGFSIAFAHGVPSRLPDALQAALAYERYDFKTDAYNPGCWLGNDEDTSKLLPVCLKTNRRDAIVIWGDSHAARLSPGLREVFGSERISQFTRNGCAPLLGLGEPASSGCRDGNAAVFALIRKHPPQTVVLFGAWQNYPNDWKTGSAYAAMLEETIATIKAAGVAEIFVLGPAPRFDPSLPSRLLQSWLQHRSDMLPGRLQIDLSKTLAIEDGIERIARENGTRYISLIRLFCNNEGCLTKIPGSTSDLVTWDYGHLTTNGAILAAHAIQKMDTALSTAR